MLALLSACVLAEMIGTVFFFSDFYLFHLAPASGSVFGNALIFCNAFICFIVVPLCLVIWAKRNVHWE